MLGNISPIHWYVYEVTTELACEDSGLLKMASSLKAAQIFFGNKSSFPVIAKANSARTFMQSQYLKALVAGLRVGFCDEWKRGFTQGMVITTLFLDHQIRFDNQNPAIYNSPG